MPYISRNRVAADSYSQVVSLCNAMMDSGKNPTHYQATKMGYVGGCKRFDRDRDKAVERGDIDRQRYESFKQENSKFSCGNEVWEEPDWSLKHKPIEDIEVPGSRPADTKWNGGLWHGEAKTASVAKPKTKVPKTAKQMAALERGIAQWAREKGHLYGGRKELQEVA